jgi:hypothetical protein
MTCNLVSVVKLSTLCLSTLIVGCVQKTRDVEVKKPEIAEIAKPAVEIANPASVAPPFNGRRAFQKVADYLNLSIPARIFWFKMNESDEFKAVFESPSFEKEQLENNGLLRNKSMSHSLYLANYDWDPVRKEGILYWQCGTHYLADGRVVVGSRSVYRIMLYESDGKLEVGKIEGHYDGKWSGENPKNLTYNSGLSRFMPSSNFGKFLDFVLENYDK